MLQLFTQRFSFILLFFITPLLFLGQISIGDSAVTEAPSAIQLTEVNSRIELMNQRIKNIDKRTELNANVKEIDTLVPNFEEYIDEQIASYENFKKSHPNKQKVLNLVNKWQSHNAYLQSLQQTLVSFTEKNTLWLQELDFQRKQWQLTLENAKEKEAPNQVINLISETQSSIRLLIKKVNNQNNELLEREIDILILREKIDAVIEDLSIWKQSKEFSMAHRRHFPLWHLSDEPVKPKDKNFDAWLSFQGNIKGVLNYIVSPENEFLTLVILILLVIAWLWRIKKVVQDQPNKEIDLKASKAKKVITDNFITTIVFISTIISIVFFAHTPNLLQESLLLFSLLSAIPLVRTSIHPRFKGITYFVIVLFIMNTIKSYVWYSSSFYRAYLFIETLFAIFVLYKFTRPLRRTVRLDVNKLSTFLIKAVPFDYAVLAGALVSNILGYTNFTDLCLKMMIQGGTLVVVLYALLIVLNGFTSGTLQIYYKRNKPGPYENRYLTEKRILSIVSFFGYVFFALYFLYIIDVYDIMAEWLNEALNEPVDAGLITFTWGSIFTFFGILVGSYLITSIIAKFVDGGALDFMKLPKGVPAIISVVVRYFIIAFALIIALSYLGVDLSQFNLMAGALGLGIGFGLQNIISNFISGLILIFERPIQTDDVVEVGPLLGHVRKIGVRSSNIRTFNGAEVVVPNSNLISNEVINWTLSDNVKRIEIKVGTAYGSSMKQVVDIINDVATNYEHTLKEPEPLALFDEFGDSSLNFRLLFWVPVEYGILSKSAVSIEIYDRFDQEGITIPFPQRDVNFKKEDLEALTKTNIPKLSKPENSED
jgi:small-conductance mechanosensitive channel